MVIKNLTSSELSRLLLSKENEPKLYDKSFKYFDVHEMHREVVYVALSDDEKSILGLAGFKKSPLAEEEHFFWFNYVTVAPEFRGQNVAKYLIQAIGKHISTQDNNAIVKLSYTETGEVLSSLIQETFEGLGITLWHKKLYEFEYKKN